MIYILVLTLMSGLAITSCSEETVLPSQSDGLGTGTSQDPIKP